MKATPHPPRCATRPTDRARREQPRSLAERVLELLARRDAVPLGVPELLRRLGLGARQEAELRRALAELERAGRVAPVKGERWFPSLAADLVPGRLRLNRAGKGFLLPDDPGLEEIVVPADATGTATHFRIWQSNGTTAVIDGDVGTSGSDLNFNSTSITSGGTVSVTSFTITAGNA